MVIKSDKPIYALVEKHMRLNPQPMTCSDLMEIDEIRTEAISQFGGENRDARLAANKLSNVLGFMWRRELLTRYPAPVTDTSFARYSYEWSKKEEPPVKPILPTPPRVGNSSKMPLTVTERDGGVEIELDRFVIFIKPK